MKLVFDLIISVKHNDANTKLSTLVSSKISTLTSIFIYADFIVFYLEYLLFLLYFSRIPERYTLSLLKLEDLIMSKKEGSVAPKERINIKYVPATGGDAAEVELPLNLLVVGDMKGKPEDSSIEERTMVSIDKNNFSAVMSEMDISLNLNVANKLDEKASPDDELNVSLDIKSLNDFSPDNIVRSVPELRKLLELREALTAVKGPLGNVPAFRARIAELLENEESRAQLLKELNLVNDK